MRAIMANIKGFGHQVILILSLSFFIISGCSTVPVPQENNIEKEEYSKVITEELIENDTPEVPLAKPVEDDKKKFIDKVNQATPKGLLKAQLLNRHTII